MSFKLHQGAISGEAYTRCHQVVISNSLGGAPAVTFHQERIITADGQPIRRPVASAMLSFDPAAEIPVINPETGEATGETVTQGALYAMVYSAYIAAVSPPAADEEEPA